uniref:Neur_chan_LBD domain-containing protein n=1 Tax=Haemonchus placei TaxID=6290 RepID=A0A0N4WXA9_HAEPC
LWTPLRSFNFQMLFQNEMASWAMYSSPICSLRKIWY